MPKIIDVNGTTIPLIPGSRPPYKRNYRMSPIETQELKAQVHEYIDRGWIRPSTSPYGAPILFIKKPKGPGFRCVLDYRELNKQTIRNRCPLGRIDDLLDQARSHCWFSSCDMASGYYQIGLSEVDMQKTAFSALGQHWEWCVMPQGLVNAPHTFSRCMTEAFGDLIGKAVLIYLDDVLILGRSTEEHLENLRKCFQVLREKGLFAKLSKCEFFKRELTYVGHVLSASNQTRKKYSPS